MIYRSTITIGGLRLPESRKIADLLLKGVTKGEWNDAIAKKNILQARSISSARIVGGLVRERLVTMQPEMWKMVRDGIGTVPIQAVFACALKHSKLLLDFMLLVVADQFRLFSPTVPKKLWGKYLEGCQERDPQMPLWSPATCQRLRLSILQSLAQAGYLDSTKSCRLRTVHLGAQVEGYLRHHQELEVLEAMLVGNP